MAEENQGPNTGVTAHLSVDGAEKAVAFYEKAFAAKTMAKMPADDGKRLMHAHLMVNGGSLMLADPFPEYGQPPEKPGGYVLHLQVDDADAWYKRAVEAGATPLMPPEDMFWGDRYGQVTDPFGVRWAFGSPSAAKA